MDYVVAQLGGMSLNSEGYCRNWTLSLYTHRKLLDTSTWVRG